MFGRNKNKAHLPGSNAVQSRTQVTSANVMERLAEDYMRDRKWRLALRFILVGLGILYVFGAFIAAGTSGISANASKPHTAVIDLDGVISRAQGNVSADSMNTSLRRAFEAVNSTAVVLRINSPGGSPVQSDEINAEIVRLKALYPQKPLHVVISDVCASGGYYIAAAADNIYANRSSIVGLLACVWTVLVLLRQ